jgi:hypothetical protein
MHELEPVRKGPRVSTKGLRVRIGRTPAEIAEIAEGAEVYWEGDIGAVFNNCLGLLKRYN